MKEKTVKSQLPPSTKNPNVQSNQRSKVPNVTTFPIQHDTKMKYYDYFLKNLHRNSMLIVEENQKISQL